MKLRIERAKTALEGMLSVLELALETTKVDWAYLRRKSFKVTNAMHSFREKEERPYRVKREEE